jgi:hypothetical protein
MPNFSQRSKDRLKTCDNKIQLICNEAIKYTDFTIVTGHRTKEEQNDLYEKGFSKLKWPKGKHNSSPSQAVDVAPYIKPFGAIFGGPEQVKRIVQQTGKSKAEVNSFIEKAYARLVGILEGIAMSNGINIRVGLDWDNDFNTLDQTFHDLGHIELDE